MSSALASLQFQCDEEEKERRTLAVARVWFDHSVSLLGKRPSIELTDEQIESLEDTLDSLVLTDDITIRQHARTVVTSHMRTSTDRRQQNGIDFDAAVEHLKKALKHAAYLYALYSSRDVTAQAFIAGVTAAFDGLSVPTKVMPVVCITVCFIELGAQEPHGTLSHPFETAELEPYVDAITHASTEEVYARHQSERYFRVSSSWDEIPLESWRLHMLVDKIITGGTDESAEAYGEAAVKAWDKVGTARAFVTA